MHYSPKVRPQVVHILPCITHKWEVCVFMLVGNVKNTSRWNSADILLHNALCSRENFSREIEAQNRNLGVESQT